jgi:hypothetical protein
VPALALRGTDLVGVREAGGIDVFGLGPGGALLEKSLSSAPFRYGLAHAFHGGRLYLASGDWERAQSFDLDAEDGAPKTLATALLSNAELSRPSAWRHGAPRRLLLPFGEHVAEISSFGGQATGLLHPVSVEGEAVRFAVPAGPYVAGIAGADRLWLVQGDKQRYRTTVVEVVFDAQGGSSARSQVFLGAAVGAARYGERIYVADREVGVRVFETGASGLVHLGSASLEVER